MKSPKVSVLMTIYNHQNYLKHSIKSIINQSHSNLELIAIDNGSTDYSKKILKDIKNKKIRKFFLKKNIGRTKCLNFGLKKCNSQLISIQDADDISNKYRLIKTLTAFNKDKTIGLVFSGYQVVDENEKIKKKFNKQNFNNFYSKLKYKNLIPHSSVTFKKNAFTKKPFFYDEK